MILGIVVAFVACVAIGIVYVLEMIKLIVDPGLPPGWSDAGCGSARLLFGWRCLMRCLGILGLVGAGLAIAAIILLP